MTAMPKKNEVSPDPMTEALTPVADAFEAAQKNFVMSEATRDFVKRSAEQAKETAGTIRNGADKITTRLETAAAEAVSGAAALSRNLQQAVYQDVEGLFAAVEKVASAASMKEAAQIHVDFLRARNEVNVARAKAAADYLLKAFTQRLEAMQESLNKAA